METVTQHALLATLTERFGEDPMRWAFECPHCGDIATGQDFRDALDEHPRTGKGGEPVAVSDLLGTSCIGRVLGALTMPLDQWRAGGNRGCDWVAYGLFRGPVQVVLPEGGEVFAFRPAPGT